MFNIFLALFTGVFIGWNFHNFYLALDAHKLINTQIKLSQPLLADINISSVPTLAQKSEIKRKDKPMKNSFYSLLQNDLFSSAMSLYLHAPPERVSLYKSTLINHLKKRAKSHPKITQQQIEEYMEIEPNHEEIKLLLVEIYKNEKSYKESIQLLTEIIDAGTHIAYEKLYDNLIKTSKLYITLLKNNQDFQQLELFLETQIEYGVKSSFFTFTLAKHYLTLDSIPPAIKLLKEIEFDDEYGKRAKALLEKIANNEKIIEEYTYKLPLKKEGSHFTIEVTINNTPLTLLLDTGATLTMIDEEKISSLTLIKDDITMKTAGGEISAQLQEAEKFTIGDIEINNFRVTTSMFKQEHADGLLGMNFFQKFKFKINQEEQLLYLSEK